MTFTDLLDRLLHLVRLRLRNGELTERGLARRIGLSQPHMHNVLSGFRVLTTSTADRILNELGLTVADLLDHPEAGPHRGPGRASTGTENRRKSFGW